MEDKQVILIVEDESVNRKILRQILSERYTVLEAENGEQAWELLSKHKAEIDAVIMELVMPVMDGYGLLERIRQASMSELPTIATTSADDTEAEQKALDAGAWDFVPKPYNAKILFPRLRNAMARRQVSVYNRMRKMAAHDPLTGLHNRGRLFEKMQEMVSQNPNLTFALLRMDIDHFALYNTSFGEVEGDRLIRFLASCLDAFAGGKPLCAYGRISADIFCVCFPYEGALSQVQEKIARIQQRLMEYRKDYRISLSAGLYVIDDPSLSAEDFYFRASIAAQKCKNQYETCLAVYDAEEISKYASEIAMANEMQQALDEERFVLYLQPKVNLTTEKACGAEALVRWLHPVRGVVSPGEFIPVFEKNGFISKLDYYVWEHTCRILRGWLDEGRKPYPISVNVSRISLYNPQLLELMLELVERYELPASLLQLEITESAYMTNPALMKQTIHSLRMAGFTILMDDFGSGYSSLNMLKEIEMDILKIDMKFLPVDQEVEKGEIILASIIKMANWLGMPVVVEGVETRRQRDFLEGAGCDCVQGYYYARPLPLSNFEKQFLDQTPAAMVSSEQAEVRVPKHNMMLLVIDDSASDCSILMENLGDLYHIRTCDTAESGLAYLKTHVNKIKLILVDSVLPGMSGLDFLRLCQRSSALRAIPKIILTCSDSRQTQIEAFREGAYDYITKPLNEEILRARVNHVMELNRRTSTFDVAEQEHNLLFQRDPTTRLLSKRSFRELADRVLEAMPKNHEALLVIDIDNFKQVNDRYGHLAGDKVISCVAGELQNTFRKTDILGRFGGDEFVALMTNIPNQDVAKHKATELINSVLYQCTQRLNINTSISVGLSFCEQGDNMDAMFARADQALYEAKRAGKGRLIVYGERVPPVRDDEKPVVLVCSGEALLYPTLALAYGKSAAFASVSEPSELLQCLERFGDRIYAVCLDMDKRQTPEVETFYQHITAYGAHRKLLILAVCKDGNMEQLRDAVRMEAFNVLLLPAQQEVIQQRLMQALTFVEKENCLRKTGGTTSGTRYTASKLG